jgi:hypothetical protein
MPDPKKEPPVRRHRLIVLVAVLVVVVLGAAGAWWGSGSGGASRDPQAAARTSFPDLAPATGEPVLPSLATLSPPAGEVVQAEGPFDDRFYLQDLRLDDAKLTGTATITSDVSEILEFEALAGFYDREGQLRGTARHVYHLDESTSDHAHDEGTPDESHPFTIEVPEDLADIAVSAAVGVPVLVNE